MKPLGNEISSQGFLFVLLKNNKGILTVNGRCDRI